MFVPDPTEKTVQIPVRMVDGEIQTEYGTELPLLREGTLGELIVRASDVKDKHWLDLLTREQPIVFLGKGTTVRVIMSRGASPAPGEAALPEVNRSEFLRFVRGHTADVILQTDQLLLLRGNKPGELQPCPCQIPALKRTAESLNQAYSLLSEVYEPHRRSHTGNVFDKAFAKPTEGDKWLSLRDLRDHVQAEAEAHLKILVSPWWWRGDDLGWHTTWAMIHVEPEGTHTVSVIEGQGIIRAQHYFADRAEAVYWLEGEQFERFNGAKHYPQNSPPEPPYRMVNGIEIRVNQ
ncbi:MAG: hypothetical protein WBO24_13905 [Nitrospirales bacterium]